MKKAVWLVSGALLAAAAVACGGSHERTAARPVAPVRPVAHAQVVQPRPVATTSITAAEIPTTAKADAKGKDDGKAAVGTAKLEEEHQQLLELAEKCQASDGPYSMAERAKKRQEAFATGDGGPSEADMLDRQCEEASLAAASLRERDAGLSP